ncbi:MAG: hypothetical protein ACR2P2_13510 [Nakamurella sp.]
MTVEGDGSAQAKRHTYQGSGAESTIHGLLAMQVLDASPDLAALARASATVSVRDGLTVVEAETGTLTGSPSHDETIRVAWRRGWW